MHVCSAGRVLNGRGSANSILTRMVRLANVLIMYMVMVGCCVAYIYSEAVMRIGQPGYEFSILTGRWVF